MLLYIQQWKDDPIKAKQDLDTCLILGAKKAVVVAIQAFEQPSLKARTSTLTLMDVSDRCDRLAAQKFNIDLASPNAQMGMFIGELSMPLPLVAKAKPVVKVGQEAFAFMRQSSKFFKPLSMRAAVVNPRMTMTRPLLIQEASAKHMTAQRAFLESVNNPVYRSGIVGEGTVGKLTDRSVRKIDPLKLSAVKPGTELDWLSVNAPKIRQLQIVKGKDFDRFIKSTFKDQSLTEQQIRRLLNFSGFETYPRPIGLPENIVVEFSKKNGGMIYRKLGTTESQNRVVRVCPGLGKESVVSSTIKWRVERGTLRQQTPYVVQRKDKEFLRTDGTWTIKKKDPLTHLPLETYEFKGWE